MAIHDVVVQILNGFPRGRGLDIPAGEGALAERLIQSGFEVLCCDLYPEIFHLQGIEIKQGDLSTRLPYEDAQFDFIVCVEGLEHIENPQQAIREFQRLLRPGGQLIASIPNVLNIEERFKWLLYGYTSHFKPVSREYIQNLGKEFRERPEIALHVHPFPYTELRYLLEKNGFEIVRLYRDKPKANLWVYWPVVGLIRLVGLLTPDRKKRERWTSELQSDEILLGGNTLIVHAQKCS